MKNKRVWPVSSNGMAWTDLVAVFSTKKKAEAYARKQNRELETNRYYVGDKPTDLDPED